MALRSIDGGTFEIDDIAVPVRITINPRARRLTLSLGRERCIKVTCPAKRHVADALAMVADREEWIREQLHLVPPPIPFAPGTDIPILGTPHKIVTATNLRSSARCANGEIISGGDTPAAMQRRIEALMRKLSLQNCQTQAETFAHKLDVTIKTIRVRHMHSRWGSCSTDGDLSFSWRLIFAPPRVMSYVIAHEVAHRQYMDHSKKFWKTVESLDPDYRCAGRWLKSYGAQLHAYGQKLSA